MRKWTNGSICELGTRPLSDTSLEVPNALQTMVGGLSCIVSLSMAELAAGLPTAGGIYYWSYRKL